MFSFLGTPFKTSFQLECCLEFNQITALSFFVSIYLSLSIFLSIYLSIYLSVCLYIWIYIYIIYIYSIYYIYIYSANNSSNANAIKFYYWQTCGKFLFRIFRFLKIVKKEHVLLKECFEKPKSVSLKNIKR